MWGIGQELLPGQGDRIRSGRSKVVLYLRSHHHNSENHHPVVPRYRGVMIRSFLLVASAVLGMRPVRPVGISQSSCPLSHLIAHQRRPLPPFVLLVLPPPASHLSTPCAIELDFT